MKIQTAEYLWLRKSSTINWWCPQEGQHCFQSIKSLPVHVHFGIFAFCWPKTNKRAQIIGRIVIFVYLQILWSKNRSIESASDTLVVSSPVLLTVHRKAAKMGCLNIRNVETVRGFRDTSLTKSVEYSGQIVNSIVYVGCWSLVTPRSLISKIVWANWEISPKFQGGKVSEWDQRFWCIE